MYIGASSKMMHEKNTNQGSGGNLRGTMSVRKLQRSPVALRVHATEYFTTINYFV